MPRPYLPSPGKLGGRPTKPKSERRSFVVMCCLNREEHRALRTATSDREISMSQFLREAGVEKSKERR